MELIEMFGFGTIVNALAIIVGGIIGMYFGKQIGENRQNTLYIVCGISVLFIGISGVMEKMLFVENGMIVSGETVHVVISLAVGTLIGELLNIENLLESFGHWLKVKSNSIKDKYFVEGFVDASLTVCIGAMAIIGAINDGLYHDSSILITKSILDFIIIMVMATSMGKGTIFSFVPVLLFQGSITILANNLIPLLTTQVLDSISLVGSILIFCVGLNLVWGKKVSVANMLPSIIIAVILTILA